jgi:ribosomal protein L11 methyltransferase
LQYPALDVETNDERVLALVDDFSPTAIDEHDGVLTIFFSHSSARDQARDAITRAMPQASLTPRDVDDEDWARRSQTNITPITVGRVTVAPPWNIPTPPAPRALPAPPALPAHVTVIIEPSMGFGTGHHATTRLCLRALQATELAGADVLDVGTGSGVLAIAACGLGARCAIGIDNDADAIRSANDNLQLNDGAGDVHFVLADLAVWLDGRRADVVTANLTGAVLERAAASILAAARPGGTLILSGLLTPEQPAVLAAFRAAHLADAFEEDGWAALILKKV